MGGQYQCAVNETRSVRIVPLPELPLQIQCPPAKTVIPLKYGLRFELCLGDRVSAGDALRHLVPAVRGPVDWKQQNLSPESLKSILVGVQRHPPRTIGRIDQASIDRKSVV